ncbi:unnamed protein product [Rotaria socialis]
MTLESLMNKSIREIFEYLSTDDVLRAFYGLDTRLNVLICDHIENHDGLFQCISKPLFDKICIEYLPKNQHRIRSLYLSDNNNSPQHIECFLDSNFHLRDFTQLRSLTLKHIHNDNTLTRIISEFSHLPLLTKLKLCQFHIPNHPQHQMKFVSRIWNLPKLAHITLNIIPEYKCCFPAPTAISPNVEHLFVTGVYFASTQMDDLFRSTPRLRSLLVEMTCENSIKPYSVVLPSLNHLHITIHSGEKNAIKKLLGNLPNLNTLKIEMFNFCLNGNDWETIITKRLLKLKQFAFKIEDDFSAGSIINTEMAQLLETFRSQFWIDTHQWFVQFDLFETDEYSLYTLPYAFDDFSRLPILSKSTCPDDYKYFHAYDRVTNLSSPLLSHGNKSQFHFHNLHQLSIKCPIYQSGWSFISNLNYLHTLSLYWYDGGKSVCSLLQSIIDRAPKLKSLRLLKSPSAISQMISFRYKSSSIRQLDLQPLGDWYDKQECEILKRSPLGMQCETLCIRVENRACIFDIVDTMTNLRSLNVRSRDDTWKENVTSDDDELLLWLKKCLPSTCTITRDTLSQSRHIRLWIR